MLRRVSPAYGNVLPAMLLLVGLVTIATGQTTFTSPTFIPTSNVTTAVASGDFNQDGLPDLVVTDAQTNTAVVLFQSSGGHFTPGPSLATGKGPDEIATGYFGTNLGFAVANGQDHSISVFFGDGTGTFFAKPPLSLSGNPKGLVSANFHGGSTMDIAVLDCVQSSGCSLKVFQNVSGVFTLEQTIAIPGPVPPVAPGKGLMVTADFNHDGRPDVALINGNNQVMMFTSGAGGTLSLHSSFNLPAGTLGDGIAWGSFNHDFNLDLAIRVFDTGSCTTDCTNHILVYLNSGSGSFVLRSKTLTANNGGFVTTADVNGDQIQDLVSVGANFRDPSLQYALGHGDGTFAAPVTVTNVNGDANGILVRALNRDSRHDIAVVTQDALVPNVGGTYVYFNVNAKTNCTPPTSAHLSASICFPGNGAVVNSPVTVKGAGNSPAGIKRIELWIDGVKRFQEWNDQLRTSIALAAGKHRIAVQAIDQNDGATEAVVNITVP
jgi:hypothetical protein